jgi:hypothetical protein
LTVATNVSEGFTGNDSQDAACEPELIAPPIAKQCRTRRNSGVFVLPEKLPPIVSLRLNDEGGDLEPEFSSPLGELAFRTKLR